MTLLRITRVFIVVCKTKSPNAVRCPDGIGRLDFVGVSLFAQVQGSRTPAERVAGIFDLAERGSQFSPFRSAAISFSASIQSRSGSLLN